MGSAAVHHLARRGQRVLGLDRFPPGHERGSSHGGTRMIRLGYFEHPSYVPLLRRTYALWRELEVVAGEKILHVTGIAEMGHPDSALVAGTLEAARLHGLAHDVLAAADVMRRFPAFRLPADFVGVVQPDGGFLQIEPALRAHRDLAQAAGAELRFGTAVHAIAARGGHVRVATDGGEIEAGATIVTAGAWVQKLLPDLPVRLRVTRQVMAWFAPRDAAPFAPDRCPVFLLESPHGMHYGFPADDMGVKFAKHYHADEAVDPDTCDSVVSAADEALIRPALAEFLPQANGSLRHAKTCLYTMTPDGDFIVDQLDPHIVVASPCSGHGFKFAPVIGEIAADLATTGATPHDISRFRLARFA